MVLRALYIVLMVVLIGAMGATAVENKGAEEIILHGGSRGKITFPHHRHQNALGDCKICHKLFAQEKGSIGQLKKSGQLIKKQVMNKLCISCHKAKKKEGQSSGPVKCAECHVKDKG